MDRDARRHAVETLGDITQVVRSPDLTLLLHNFGCEDGSGIRDMVQRILELGGLSPNSTLGDLKRLLRVDVAFVCTNLCTGRAFLLDAESAPRMRVCDAVYASCCVPLLFTPVQLDKTTLLVDGCLSCNQPEVFDPASTLFVTVTFPRNATEGIASWPDFLQGMVRANTVCQQPRVDHISHTVPHHYLTLHIPTDMAQTSFDLNQNIAQSTALAHSGYAQTLDALNGSRLSASAWRLVGFLSSQLHEADALAERRVASEADIDDEARFLALLEEDARDEDDDDDEHADPVHITWTALAASPPKKEATGFFGRAPPPSSL